jgi:hypothetical protein
MHNPEEIELNGNVNNKKKVSPIQPPIENEQKSKEKVEKSHMKNISAIVRDWGESTSLHGVGQGFRATSIILRIVWYLLTLGSFGYCVYASYSQVRIYLKYGVVTSIEDIYETPARFPAVTICNLNAYDSSLLEEMVESDNFQNISSVKNLTYEYAMSDTLHLRTAINSYIEANYDEEEIASYTFKIEDILIFCQFGGIYLISSLSFLINSI